MKKLLLIITAIFFFIPQLVSGGTFNVDPSHTEVGFSVKHLVITNVKGAFKSFKGEYTVDADNKLTDLWVEVDVNSIDTRIKKRDDHLKSADFFDVSKHPVITFKSKNIKAQGNNKYLVSGELNIRNVSKAVDLTGEVIGPITDPWGNTRIGVVFTGKIHRKDFGLTYNKVLENGGLLIGDEVKISLEGEGVIEK